LTIVNHLIKQCERSKDAEAFPRVKAAGYSVEVTAEVTAEVTVEVTVAKY